jgi:hypothetical protein
VLGLLAMAASVSPPPYRYQDELRARAAIQRFAAEESARSARWDTLLAASGPSGASFDQLDGSLAKELAASYQRSFDQLAAANPAPAIPSKNTLLQLESYARQRSQAARQLALGRTGKKTTLKQAHRPCWLHAINEPLNCP